MNEYIHSRGASLVAEVDGYERAEFIRKTYNHLGGAILAFIALEAVLLHLPFTPALVQLMLGNRLSWLVVLLAFIGISYLAEQWANSAVSREKQYWGLALYIVAEAIIFLPILYIAAYFAKDPYVIAKAGVVTAGLFTGLTFIAFTSKKDFSFLGGILKLAAFVALGIVVCSILFSFTLGTIFAGVMVVFAGGCILYDTSNIIHRYRTDQYVAASLSLFASVALMFWYILQLFLSKDR